ncbi:hypothetical protein Emed_004341 [Eimeria media]
MTRGASSAAHNEVVDLEIDNDKDSFLSFDENHERSQTNCVWGGPCTSGKRGAKKNASLFHAFRSKLLIHFLVVALLLTLSLCTHKLRGSLKKGMQHRRLAAGGSGEESDEESDETTRPPSPDFTDFCLQLGAWNPSDPSPGDPRASPTFVQSFFESLDQTTDQQPPAQAPPPQTPGQQLLLAPPTAGGKKRPLEEEEGEALPGPSWKVAKTEGQTSATQFVSPGGLQQPQASFQPLPGQPTPSDPFSLQQPSTSTAPLVPQPAPSTSAAAEGEAALSSAGAAAAAAAAAGSSVSPPAEGSVGGEGLENHPFVTLPTVMPGLKPRHFLAGIMRSATWVSRHNSHLLRPLREMFRKQQLNEIDAHNMVEYSERLAAHAYYTMGDNVGHLGPLEAATRLGRKFLVLDYLLRASYVLGQSWHSKGWWEELMERIPHRYALIRERDMRVSQFNLDLALDLSAAIELLKKGVFPPPAVVVSLKRRLFCMQPSPVIFKQKPWDPWREDDEEFQRPPES